jgi:hypothetical protein
MAMKIKKLLNAAVGPEFYPSKFSGNSKNFGGVNSSIAISTVERGF